MALEGEEDLQDVIEKSREMTRRRTASKLMREVEGIEGGRAVASGRSDVDAAKNVDDTSWARGGEVITTRGCR